MGRKKILVWETLATVSGGQKMTLTIMDMLSDQFEFCCLIPAEGMLSEELKKRGIPYILMGDQTLPTGVKGKQVIFRYGLMSLRNVRKSLGAIRNYKPDILYAPGPAALPWSAVCGALTRKPVVWHLHHIFLDGATKKLLNLCGSWKSVRRIIAVSNCVGDQIVNATAHKKVEVLYNPVDVEKYAGGNPAQIAAELKTDCNLDLEGCYVLGHVALLQRSKKQDFVLKVIEHLKEENIHVVGLFAGETREGDYFEELEDMTCKMRLEDNVRFLGRRNDIPDFLKLLDVLMIPSSFEGFPLAGLEAAAAGIPVAACDAAGAEEFVRVSDGGVVFKENDVENAANAIKAILKNKEHFRKAGVAFASKMSNHEYAVKIRQAFEFTERV